MKETAIFFLNNGISFSITFNFIFNILCFFYLIIYVIIAQNTTQATPTYHALNAVINFLYSKLYFVYELYVIQRMLSSM
jgi:hypothetical protein